MAVTFKKALRPLLLFLVTCGIIGPKELTHYVGENATFRWSTDDNSTILSATWGIKKGNIADPQYINVDIRSNKAYISSYLRPELQKRISFDGELKKGRAWFTLKNVTVDDTNEYLASISYNASGVRPFSIFLTVKKQEGESKAGSLAIDIIERGGKELFSIV